VPQSKVSACSTSAMRGMGKGHLAGQTPQMCLYLPERLCRCACSHSDSAAGHSTDLTSASWDVGTRDLARQTLQMCRMISVH
jgi:hypothetical protein